MHIISNIFQYVYVQCIMNFQENLKFFNEWKYNNFNIWLKKLKKIIYLFIFIVTNWG
jgi:hypothetical protein